jgi:hypothetical protein
MYYLRKIIWIGIREEAKRMRKEFEDVEKGEAAAVPTKNESRPLLNMRNTSLSAPTGMGAVNSI